MKVLFCCPGQGSQLVGMLQHLPNTLTTQQLLQQANDTLAQSYLQLDTATALQSTRSVQLCLLISAVCYGRYLIEQAIQPDFCCGLSIGVFPAAVLCGALDFADALKLVALRGELMQQAYPSGFGLSVIIGLTRWQLEPLIQSVHTAAEPVYLANINSEDQLVIAGHQAAMQQLMQLAMQAGARHCQTLAVNVPSHCELLNEAAQQLYAAMQTVPIYSPTYRYLSGSSGRVIDDSERLRQELAFNMARPVHWQTAMLSAFEREVRLVLELPPGRTLTQLAKTIIPQAESIAVAESPLQLIKTLTERTKFRRD